MEFLNILVKMFIKQILYKSKIKTSIFRVFNSYGPGEDLNYLKKGMVSIYCSYVWRKKPISSKKRIFAKVSKLSIY